jgi:hypothetical protein
MRQGNESLSILFLFHPGHHVLSPAITESLGVDWPSCNPVGFEARISACLERPFPGGDTIDRVCRYDYQLDSIS